jgi:HAD superfamily hydrolase (TIGR01509 family)
MSEPANSAPGTRLRAILFDFNGVILDDEHLHFELFQRVLEEQGLSLTEEDYYRDFVGFDDETGFRYGYQVAEEPLPEELLAELCQRKGRYYLQAMAEREVPFFPGALELIRKAHALGLALGVVSGALEGEVVLALERGGVRDLFETVVAAEAVSLSKPDPEGYLLGVERLASARSPGLDPSQVLAIEDTPEGLEAARSAGLVALGVAHTYDSSRLDKAHRAFAGVHEIDLESLGDLFVQSEG